MKKIDCFQYAGDGMLRIYDNKDWMVGIKNYKKGNDIRYINCLELHKETEELFVLIEGSCTLVYANEEESKLIFSAIVMAPDTVYSIPRGLLHNTITKEDSKLIIIENSNTSMENSEIQTLTSQDLEELREICIRERKTVEEMK